MPTFYIDKLYGEAVVVKKYCSKATLARVEKMHFFSFFATSSSSSSPFLLAKSVVIRSRSERLNNANAASTFAWKIVITSYTISLAWACGERMFLQCQNSYVANKWRRYSHLSPTHTHTHTRKKEVKLGESIGHYRPFSYFPSAVRIVAVMAFFPPFFAGEKKAITAKIRTAEGGKGKGR